MPRKDLTIDRLLEKHNYTIRELAFEVNRLTNNNFNPGQFAGKRKYKPSENLRKALKQIEKGLTINNRKFRKKSSVREDVKRTKTKVKAKKIEKAPRKKKELKRLRAEKELRRFTIDTTCETDSFTPYRHNTFFVYRGKAGTFRGIKQSGVRTHNEVFIDHRILIVHSIEEFT